MGVTKSTVLTLVCIFVSLASIALFTSSIVTKRWIEGYKRFNSTQLDNALNITTMEKLGDEVNLPTYIGLHEICQILQGITDGKIVYSKEICQSYSDLRKIEAELKKSEIKDSGIIELMDRVLNPLHTLYILLFVTVVMAAISMAFSVLRSPCFKNERRHVKILMTSSLLFILSAFMGFGTLVYAEFRLTAGHDYLLEKVSVLQNILPNVDAKNIILNIMHYNYYRGFSHILAWSGEACLILAFLLTMTEIYVVKTKSESQSSSSYGRFDL